jgi:hypothetical protein
MTKIDRRHPYMYRYTVQTVAEHRNPYGITGPLALDNVWHCDEVFERRRLREYFQRLEQHTVP